jgi:hypothetical protein
MQRCGEKVNVNEEPWLGDLILHAEAVRVQRACFSCKVSGHGYIGAERTHSGYFPSRAQGVGVSAGRYLAGRPRD